MSVEVTRDLFDRWELVWHEDRYDLVASCVGPTYTGTKQRANGPSPLKLCSRTRQDEGGAAWRASRRVRPHILGKSGMVPIHIQMVRS